MRSLKCAYADWPSCPINITLLRFDSPPDEGAATYHVCEEATRAIGEVLKTCTPLRITQEVTRQARDAASGVKGPPFGDLLAMDVLELHERGWPSCDTTTPPSVSEFREHHRHDGD